MPSSCWGAELHLWPRTLLLIFNVSVLATQHIYSDIGTGTWHLTHLPSKFVISFSPKILFSQSFVSQLVANSSLRQNHPGLLFFYHAIYRKALTSNRYRIWLMLAFLLYSLPETIIFHLCYCNDFLMDPPASALPNTWSPPTVCSQRIRHSCLFKTQVGPCPSLLQTLRFPHIPLSIKVKLHHGCSGPWELAHLQPYSPHLLHLSLLVILSGLTSLLDAS